MPALIADRRFIAMVCGDAEVTVGSTLSAIVIPTASTKTTNTVSVLDAAPHGVLSGVAMDKPNPRMIRNFYASVSAIPEMLDLGKPTHLTFYFLTAQQDGSGILDLVSLFRHPVFSTPPMPLQACMTDRAIELLQEGSEKEEI